MKHDRKLYTLPKAGIACTGHPVGPRARRQTRTQKIATAAIKKPLPPVEAARNITLDNCLDRFRRADKLRKLSRNSRFYEELRH